MVRNNGAVDTAVGGELCILARQDAFRRMIDPRSGRDVEVGRVADVVGCLASGQRKLIEGRRGRASSGADQRLFRDASYAIIGSYIAEVWPNRRRASGMGFSYGVGNPRQDYRAARAIVPLAKP